MNELTRVASQTADGAWVLGLMTAVFLLFFLGWAAWAWAPSNSEKMKRAARMPLEDGEL